MIAFRKMLTERQISAKTRVCVGLDPLREKMPTCVSVQWGYGDLGIRKWMCAIVDATAEFACMYKPQSAHWEAVPGGVEALGDTVAYIHKKHSGIPVFLDCKRGDIARTQAQYRVAHFELQNVDGMNFSPYMGKDTMKALVDKETLGRALVGLCYTSNPDAREIQDLQIHDYGDRPLWEIMAEKILAWATELGVVENAGLVMAAAYEKPPKGSKNIYSRHLVCCRQIVGDKLWFLIPGIGTQGGCVEETVKNADVGPGSIAINSSSEIIFASSGEDFEKAAAQKAKELRDQINQALSL